MSVVGFASLAALAVWVGGRAAPGFVDRLHGLSGGLMLLTIAGGLALMYSERQHA